MQTECKTVNNAPTKAQVALYEQLCNEIVSLGGDFTLPKEIYEYDRETFSKVIDDLIAYKRRLENTMEQAENIVRGHVVRKEELGMCFKLAVGIEFSKNPKRAIQRSIKTAIALYSAYQRVKRKAEEKAKEGEFS